MRQNLSGSQSVYPFNRKLAVFLTIFSLLAGYLVLPPQFTSLVPTAEAAGTELFFSEYIEGSSNNKAVEIYNPTAASVNLATLGYKIEMYFKTDQ